MDLEILCLFLLESSEQIFERPKKISLDETGMPKFLDTTYAVSEYGLRNWVSIFFREKWGNFWRAYKIGLDCDQTGFLLTHINPLANVLKIVGVGDFVERAFLYKTWYHTKL